MRSTQFFKDFFLNFKSAGLKGQRSHVVQVLTAVGLDASFFKKKQQGKVSPPVLSNVSMDDNATTWVAKAPKMDPEKHPPKDQTSAGIWNTRVIRKILERQTKFYIFGGI